SRRLRAARENCLGRDSFLRTEVRGGLFLGALPELERHRFLALFEDVADQANGARHDADTAHRAPVDAELAGEGADRAGGVDHQLLLLADLLHPLAVLPVEAGLARDLEQSHRARIDGLVDRMPEA